MIEMAAFEKQKKTTEGITFIEDIINSTGWIPSFNLSLLW